MLRIKLQGLVKGFQGLFIPPEIYQHIAFVIMDESIMRIESKCLTVSAQFVLILPESVQSHPPVILDQRQTRITTKRLLKGF